MDPHFRSCCAKAWLYRHTRARAFTHTQVRELLRETMAVGLGLGLSGGAAGGGSQLGGLVVLGGVGRPGPEGFEQLLQRMRRVLYSSVCLCLCKCMCVCACVHLVV